MTWPLVQFVAAPQVGATVRFDFNAAGSWSDDQTWPEHEGFTIGAPSLEGDPGGVGVEYGYRTLSFNLLINGRESAMRSQGRLARELLRPHNWLLIQWTPTAPVVWFKTYRTAPGEIDFELVTIDDTNSRWGLGVSLTADPWGCGEWETIPTVTINNDPTAATNPCLYVLPPIKGDAPAPLRIRAKPSVAALRTGSTVLASVMPSDLAPKGAVRATVSGTITTDVTTQSDSAAIGGSVYKIAPSASTSLTQRLTFSGPAIQHGTYKVLMRSWFSSTGGLLDVRLQSANSNVDYLAVTLSPDFMREWVDLGTIDWPWGNRVADDFLAGSSTFSAALAVGVASGSSSSPILYVDEILLVPVSMDDGDASTAVIALGNSGDTVDAAYIDGDSESVRLVTSADVPARLYSAPQVAGGFPQVSPGVTNVLRYLPSMKPGSGTAQVNGVSGDNLTTTTALDISYQPRYLYLAGE